MAKNTVVNRKAHKVISLQRNILSTARAKVITAGQKKKLKATMNQFKSAIERLKPHAKDEFKFAHRFGSDIISEAKDAVKRKMKKINQLIKQKTVGKPGPRTPGKRINPAVPKQAAKGAVPGSLTREGLSGPRPSRFTASDPPSMGMIKATKPGLFKAIMKSIGGKVKAGPTMIPMDILNKKFGVEEQKAI